MGFKRRWSRSMNMMGMPLKTMVKTERFLIKHNFINPIAEDDKDGTEDGWTVKCRMSETRYIRRYASRYKKSAKGAGDAVFKMLREVFLVFPTIESESNGIIIRCKMNNIRDFSGFKINFWIKITDEEDQIRVEYFVPFNEGVEMQLGILKAISGSMTSVASGGFNMIASVMRIEIPKKIDDVIKSYLNT